MKGVDKVYSFQIYNQAKAIRIAFSDVKLQDLLQEEKKKISQKEVNQNWEKLKRIL